MLFIRNISKREKNDVQDGSQSYFVTSHHFFHILFIKSDVPKWRVLDKGNEHQEAETSLAGCSDCGALSHTSKGF